jgi:hypothetical protein
MLSVKSYFISLFLIFVFCSALFSQVDRVAQSGMTFLSIDIGARAAAMGGSYICMDGDANALFWNPAGISTVRNFDFVAHTTSWLAGMKEHTIGLVYGTDRYGAVGISFLAMDNPAVHITQFTTGEDWIDLGYQDVVKQFALGLTYAKGITDRFSVGGQIKWAHEDLGTYDYVDRRATEVVDGLVQPLQVTNWEAKKDVLVYEFGTFYYTGYQDLRLALSIRNFAPRTRYQLEYFELPLTFSLGMALNILSTLMPDDGRQKLTISISAVQPRDYSERLQVGGEYWYQDFFAIRAGYKFNYDLESFAAGIGLKQSFGSFQGRIDYTYCSIESIFKSVHRFSFGISF